MKTHLHNNHTTPNKARQVIKMLNFKKRHLDKLRHEVAKLDTEAFLLVSDDTAYWENRKRAWALTSELIRKEC